MRGISLVPCCYLLFVDLSISHNKTGKLGKPQSENDHTKTLKHYNAIPPRFNHKLHNKYFANGRSPSNSPVPLAIPRLRPRMTHPIFPPWSSSFLYLIYIHSWKDKDVSKCFFHAGRNWRDTN